MKNVEDIYPLSPLQEGMLFHTVAEPASGVYVDQVSTELSGSIDPARFEDSWEQLLERHSALRTAFVWDGVDEPLQVVRTHATVPWAHKDWRQLSEIERDQRQQQVLDEERARGFDVASAPLMRMTLARTGERKWWWLWTFHHLLADGWSTAVLLRELFASYAAEDRPSELSAAIPYREFIAWHARQDIDAAERFWRRELRDLRAPTRLPSFDAAHGSKQGVLQQESCLNPEATRSLRRFASNHGLTLNTIVQGAWAVLLARLSLDRDVVFGTTTAGRPPELTGIESAVGLYINTLPLRATLDPDAPLVPWLKELQRRQLELRRWEFSPLSSVQRWSELPACEPLFESILVFENYPAGDSLVPDDLDIAIGDLRFDERSNYPLAILCLPDERLKLIAVHDPNRFGDKTAAMFLELLARILIGMAALPEGRLRDLRIDDDQDRGKLAAWNETACDLTRPDCIHAWFEEAASATPDSVAVIAPDRTLAYADLDRCATALAKQLQHLGVGPNTPVALLVEPSAEMVLGILGILKAGGAYVPLDPTYPSGHMRHVLEDTAAPVVLIQRGLRDRIPACSANVVTIDWDVDDLDASAPSPSVTANSLAYILYTSGTSGRPKGVLVTHQNLVHSTEAREPVYREPVGRFLLLSSFTFDSSIVGIFWTLVTGGTLVIPPRRLEQDLRGLFRLIREHEVTHTLCLPTLYSLILQEAEPGDLDTLRTVIVAGEACPGTVVRDHHRVAPSARLFNEYGPTEATVWSTVRELTPNDAADSVSIGRPIPRMHAYVLDSERRPVPAGVPGELWLAGAGIAAGYRNLDELTDSHFMPVDVIGKTEHAYRTGDLATWQPDGSLRFLGRADSQIKLRGHRIEPAGIEAVLREHPLVAEAAVAVRGTPGRLVAYLVASSTDAPLSGALREHLRANLPDFMIPDVFESVASIPRTWNGKVDYRALPDPAEADVAGDSVGPRNEIEDKLVSIWRDVLGISSIGIHDNYFALGGDSIMSIQIVSRIRAAGLRVEPRHVLECPTIAELAERVHDTSDPPTSTGPVSGEVPLAPIQAWFLGRALPAPAHWNQSQLLETPADLDASRLRRALNCVVEHHDQLRARFEQTSNGWWQVVEPPGDVEIPLSIFDLGPLEELADSGQQQHTAEAQKELTLSRAPLVRAVLFRRGTSRPAQLLLVAHHLIVDAVSWSVLIEDLENAYAQTGNGRELHLRAKTASFADWATSLQEEARQLSLRDELGRWLRILEADADDVRLDQFPSAVPTEATARTVRRTLPRELTDRVITNANETYRTRSEELLLTALALAVGRNGARASLRLYREGHGRSGDLDLSRTVGWFTSMIPVSLILESPDDAGVSIRDAKEQLRAIPARDQRYGLLRWTGLDIEIEQRLEQARDPLVLFNYLGRSAVSPKNRMFRPIPGADSTSRAPANHRSHLLEINVALHEQKLVVDWIYCDPIHRHETVDSWAEQFETELALLVSHCLAQDTGRFTASDFPESGLDEDDLGKLTAQLAQQ